jgi:hypothetical protein
MVHRQPAATGNKGLGWLRPPGEVEPLFTFSADYRLRITT